VSNYHYLLHPLHHRHLHLHHRPYIGGRNFRSVWIDKMPPASKVRERSQCFLKNLAFFGTIYASLAADYFGEVIFVTDEAISMVKNIPQRRQITKKKWLRPKVCRQIAETGNRCCVEAWFPFLATPNLCDRRCPSTNAPSTKAFRNAGVQRCRMHACRYTWS